jgi:hypothetical protein
VQVACHQAPAIYFQALIDNAIIQVFYYLNAVIVAYKYIQPIHYGKGYEIDPVLIGYKIPIARHGLNIVFFLEALQTLKWSHPRWKRGRVGDS